MAYSANYVKRDLYAEITDSIVKALEAGTRPWIKPWAREDGTRITPSMPLRHNGKPYQGINVLILWSAGRSSPYWMTYNQATQYGAHVRKGERGTTVVYAGRTTKDEGKETEKTFTFLKSYVVFNAEQIDGLPEKFHPKPLTAKVTKKEKEETKAHAEAYFDAIGADVMFGGDRACYIPALDQIRMPASKQFKTIENYYGTLAHEHIHWTAHESRLARDLSGRFGDHAYGMEELVAELGSAFVSADLGMFAVTRDDHASYLASWIRMLKEDKRAIFTVASKASQAAMMLRGFSVEEDTEDAEEAA